MHTVLIAEDDPIPRKVLRHTLESVGYGIVEAANGSEAFQLLSTQHAPSLAIVDWMMPGLNGPELCQALRQNPSSQGTYVILLTSKGKREDIVTGLEAGADDYVIKPFDFEELRARVRVGFRILSLQEGLAARVHDLEQALTQIKHLQGLLPICCYCKKIRDDRNYWRQVEEYLSAHSDIKFSHGICPKCYADELAPQLESFRLAKKEGT